jgi:DNA-binding MarR family transcriptional regulator
VSARDELFDGLERFLQYLFSLGETEGLNYLADRDLSLPQVRLLLLLSGTDEPLPLHRVGEELGLSDAAACRNVDRLVKSGSVARRESAEDRRVRLVSITDDGRALIDQHLEVRRAAVRTLVDRLPDDEVSAFAALMDRLYSGGHLSQRLDDPTAILRDSPHSGSPTTNGPSAVSDERTA